MKLGKTFKSKISKAGLLASSGLVAATLLLGVVGTSKASASGFGGGWDGGWDGGWNSGWGGGGFDGGRFDGFWGGRSHRVVRVERRSPTVIIIIFNTGERRLVNSW